MEKPQVKLNKMNPYSSSLNDAEWTIVETLLNELLTNSSQEKLAQDNTGFVPVKARWVIERSNAWVERCKSLVKNFEWTLENANAKTVFYQTSD